MTDVGIVMPVYTQKPEFLQQALESVLAQTFKGYRLVIVIDGDPQMEPLVSLYIADDPRVSIISYPVNRGVAHALNTGFKVLSEDPDLKFLTWVSSDNVYHPYFLEVLRSALDKGPKELGIVYSSFQSIDDEGKKLSDEHHLAALRQYQCQPKEKLLDSSIIGVSFMYKSEFAKAAGEYGMEPVEDYDYWLRLSEYCEIRYLPVELMNYRVNSSYSVSAQLLTTERHRKWRYAYHLTRLQARSRRGIPPALTIVYAVGAAGPAEVAAVEHIYEQTFSNYIFQIVDISPDGEPSASLAAIHHPITQFIRMPGATIQHAEYQAVENIFTDFTIVLGSELFLSFLDIQILMEHLPHYGESVISNFYTEDHTLIGYRHKGIPSVKTHLYNELFKSNELKELYRARIIENILENE